MEPFQGQISMMAFDFAPRDWAACDGSILPINQNQALYSLIGNTFGGDGQTTMALPDLRGRAALHQGNDYRRGYFGGLERATVSQATMASHSHGWQANSKPASSP
ncbi:MAG: tail fiber protein, partial [Proteobacteria bacterium]|nr:tail fiber protein [Pseudomonadota bacterium]MBU1715781.1 tail fiber protein [Pseudomonadota bacterium]